MNNKENGSEPAPAAPEPSQPQAAKDAFKQYAASYHLQQPTDAQPADVQLNADANPPPLPEPAGDRKVPKVRVFQPPAGGQKADLAWLRSFFSLTGGCILYCLSALCILIGMWQIIFPVLNSSQNYLERLGCIGTLNLYEVALLGVMLLIVLWRRVTDDAISLLVLIAIFLIVNGVALDQVVLDNIPRALAIGAACFGLALVKILVMRRYLRLSLGGGLLIGLVLLLGWNFLMAPVMAFLKSIGINAQASVRLAWQVGWFVLLAGGLSWYLATCAAGTGAGRAEHADKPFLQTAAMTRIFAGILFIIGALHQYELAYIFDVKYAFNDFIPIMALLVLLGLELPRIYGKRPGFLEIALAGIPLAIIIGNMAAGGFVKQWSGNADYFWHPTVMLVLCAAAVLRAASRTRHAGLMYVAAAYGAAIILTAGTAHPTPDLWHWKATMVLAGLSLVSAGLLYRNVALTIAGIFILALGFYTFGWLRSLLVTYSIFPLAPFLIVVGAGLTGCYLYFKLERAVALMGASMLSLGIFCLFNSGERLFVAGVGAYLVLLALLILLLRRHWPSAIILCLPFATSVGLFGARVIKPVPAGWKFVLLSFALLGAGLGVSLLKGRKRPEKSPAQPIPDPQIKTDLMADAKQDADGTGVPPT